MDKFGDASVGDWLHIAQFMVFLVLIGGGIVVGILMFFGDGIDARQSEADILNLKIRECLDEFGIDVLGNDFYENCGINGNVIESNEIMIMVCEDMDKNECIVAEDVLFSQGSNFNVCGFDASKKSDRFPRCKVVVEDNLLILTGSNQEVLTENA